MQNKKFLDKEGRDFATILAQNKINKDMPNESTRDLKHTPTKDNFQQSPASTESTEYIRGFSDSQRGRVSRSESLVALGLRAISLSKQGSSQTADSQGRDGETRRSEEREATDRTRDIRDSKAERNIRQGNIRDSETEQRTRRLDYINRELQDKARTSTTETRQLLQLCDAQNKFTSLEKEEYIQNSQSYHQLQTEKKILQQKALQAYKEAGAIIYDPHNRKPKHR